MSDIELEHRIAGALRATPSGGVRVRDAVMSRVRALPAADRPVRRPRFGVRTVRHSVAGAALAASVGSVATLSTLMTAPGGSPAGRVSAVIGDTVIATLRDTLRLVRLRDGVHRYAFVVDATRWVVDPSAPRVHADDGRILSILQLAANAN